MADEPAPQNDIDFLMSLVPLQYADGDINVIIAYQRNYRRQLEGGVRPPRAKAGTPSKGKINLALLMKGVKPKPVPLDELEVKPVSSRLRRI